MPRADACRPVHIRPPFNAIRARYPMRPCPAFLIAPLLALACPALAQPGHLTGRVDVDLPRGVIAADLCLHGPGVHGDTTSFVLNRGMNVKRVRNAAGNPLPFTATYHAGGLEYTARDTARAGVAPAGGVCVEYTGAFPVYDVAAGDYRDSDNSSVIAFTGSTLRARGESRWYPVPLHPATGRADDHLAYRIRLRCAACTRLYLNGARSRPGPEAELASDVPRELVLWIGDYPALQVDGTEFLGEAVAVDTARMFLARIGEIRGFYEQFVGVPYGPGPDVLRITPASRFGRYQFWGFFADPALALAGPITLGDFAAILGDPRHPARAPLLGVLAHELAHRYFANMVAPPGAQTELFSEPFASYLDLQARRHFFGDEAYHAGIAALRDRALDGPDLPPLDSASAAVIGSDRYRYGVAPLLLVALEREIGEARMRAFLRALLTAPPAERGRLDYPAMRRIALRSGVPTAAWERWERQCVRPPLSGNRCLGDPPAS